MHRLLSGTVHAGNVRKPWELGVFTVTALGDTLAAVPATGLVSILPSWCSALARTPHATQLRKGQRGLEKGSEDMPRHGAVSRKT